MDVFLPSPATHLASGPLPWNFHFMSRRYCPQLPLLDSRLRGWSRGDAYRLWGGRGRQNVRNQEAQNGRTKIFLAKASSQTEAAKADSTALEQLASTSFSQAGTAVAQLLEETEPAKNQREAWGAERGPRVCERGSQGGVGGRGCLLSGREPPGGTCRAQRPGAGRKSYLRFPSRRRPIQCFPAKYRSNHATVRSIASI